MRGRPTAAASFIKKRPKGCENRIRPLGPAGVSRKHKTRNLSTDTFPRTPGTVLSGRALVRLHLQRISAEPVPGLHAVLSPGGGKFQISTGVGGMEPRWRRDGKE